MLAIQTQDIIFCSVFRVFELPVKGLLLHKLVKPNFNQLIAYLVYEKHSNGHFARWMGLVTKHEQEVNLLFSVQKNCL